MEKTVNKKKYRNLIICIALLLFFLGVYVFNNVDVYDLLLVMGYYHDKITIINTADIHGHMTFEENSWGQYTTEDIHSIMGLPLVEGLMQREIAKNHDILFFDCGDMFHGTNESGINDGEGIVKLVNMMPYNALTVGSNDFNFGIDRFVEISKELNIPFLCANLYYEGVQMFESNRIFEIGGKKIGVFGLLTPDAIPKSNTSGNERITISDPVKAANEAVSELEAAGVDAIVLLSHLGDTSDKELIEYVDGIDIVFSSRKHSLYTTPVIINKTSIVEVGAWTTHIGKANLYYRDEKLSKITWTLISSKNSDLQNQKMLEISTEYNLIALDAAKDIVGFTVVELDGARTHVRTGETNFGNVLADAMKEQANADIALVNGGVIRESISEGEIDQYQLGRSLPFSNYLITIETKGINIIEALERGLRAYPNGTNGAFLHVSGIQFVFNSSKPPGERVVEVIYNEKPIDPDVTYILATSDYLYYGGDNYSEFADAPILEFGGMLKDVFKDYLKNNEMIAAKTEGRITKS